MGAAHSNQPRSVSMDNPTPAGVIDVSDEVVKRLKKGIQKQASENVSVASPPPSPKKEAHADSPKASVKPAAPSKSTEVYSKPIYVQSGGPTLSAMDMRRQMEDELHKNDGLWRQRMAKLEETLKKTNVIMEKEYSTAVDNVKQRFATAAPSHQLPPCQDLKAQLIACYKAHPGETLKCAEEVSMFRNCVSTHRIQKLDADEEREKAAAAKSSVASTAAASKAAKAG